MAIKSNLYQSSLYKRQISFHKKEVSPFAVFEKEEPIYKEPNFMPVYKPSFFTKTWAFLAKTKKYVEGTLQGGYYGLIIGLPAATAGFIATKSRASSSAITKAILYPSAIVAAFIGMQGIDPGDHSHNHKVGFFDRIGSLLKGLVLGGGFGIITGATSALLVNSVKAKSLPVFKSVLAISTIAGAAIGLFVSKFAANKRVSEIYFTMGANKNLIGEE